MEMKRPSFDKLSIREKASLLYSSGVYMMSVSEGGNAVTLFAIDDEFVEVYLDTGTRQIDRITIAMERDLDKYLEKIKIG